MNAFQRLVLQSPNRIVMPIATYPGLALTHARVKDVVCNSQAQFEAQASLHERYATPIVMSAMDLSVEAETFGCAVQISENEIPVVTEPLVTSTTQAQNLTVPEAGSNRTRVYLETVQRLSKLPKNPLVLGGCIGSFSLAARLTGVTAALELTLTDPGLVHLLLQKSAEFLKAYARAFQCAGAQGLIMAEPAAGLLSPRGLATFSSPYVKQIASSFSEEEFSIILHNCGAKQVHLNGILESGVKSVHFGAPMDLSSALTAAPQDVIVCGNLDPAGVFCQLAPAEIHAKAASLLRDFSGHRNFVLSSGCDVPPNAPLANLDAFYQAAGSVPLQ